MCLALGIWLHVESLTGFFVRMVGKSCEGRSPKQVLPSLLSDCGYSLHKSTLLCTALHLIVHAAVLKMTMAYFQSVIDPWMASVA